ncbi:MAG: YraN family protein [Pseudomonadota bacterium]|nr:YraN family protein [Pseudomonadota bacterium]MEE3070997.1 YraN family protein [Pseudomonadota bacterium]
MNGRMRYEAGLAAENVVAGQYRNQGYDILARRWRGRAGEIDIVAKRDDGLVFIEVKASKTHDQAAQALGYRQQRRLLSAAEEFAGTQPDGLLSQMRVDVALMDRSGQVSILENALMAA